MPAPATTHTDPARIRAKRRQLGQLVVTAMQLGGAIRLTCSE